jgi:hypothetical protein
MDIFSHGLWSGVIAQGANLTAKKPRKINPLLAAFWGVFPDVFAFGISFILLFWGLITGTFDRSMIPHPDAVEPAPHTGVFKLSAYLYNYSHSLVIFVIVISSIILIKYFLKKGTTLQQLIPWEMGAWLLHILCDIPTHSYRFYPTPVFWPLWGWKFNGFSWGVWWFMALNYGALITTCIVLYFKKKNK